MDRYIIKGEQKLAYGYTTGSCAAAAAKVATQMLLMQKEVHQVWLMTPKGFALDLDITHIELKEECASCAVQKDAGDDPDVTHGIYVYATVYKIAESGIVIEGGIGVGRVTKPGLDQPVGAAAINSVPRGMITKEVEYVCREQQYQGGIAVTISIPEGELLGAKTFNPKLGIVGGISVLGTSGIVEPMSDQALMDTIRVEMQVKKAEGFTLLPMAPGNYGQAFLKKQYGFELDTAVKCSNFVGDSMDMAMEMGFTKILFTGHLGKLIKVAAGVMNTHSRYGDKRMETLTDIAIRHGAGQEVQTQLLACVSTDEAVRILKEADLSDLVMQDVVEKVQQNLIKRNNEKMQVEVIIFSNVYSELAKTAQAEKYIKCLKKEEKQYK